MSTPDVNPTEAPSASAQDVNQASASSTPATDVTPAPSEPTKGDERSELLKIVKDAVKSEDQEAKSPDDPPTQGEPTPVETAAKPDTANQKVEDKLPEITDDEIKGYDRRSQKRIRQLVAEKKELASKMSTLEAAATVGHEFTSFIERNQLSNDDANTLLTIGGALRRGDFEAFLKGVMPYVQVAEEALGIKLPESIQAKVEQGLIDADMAREHARLMSDRRLLQERVHANDQALQHRETETLTNSIKSAVTEWEAGIRQSDPDYAAKQGTVLRFSQALAAERGGPRNATEALQLAQDAYAEVNKLFGQVRPAVQPTRPSPSSGSQVATSASPEPRNLMEAALAGLRRAAS